MSASVGRRSRRAAAWIAILAMLVHALAFVAHTAQAGQKAGGDLAAALVASLCLPSLSAAPPADIDRDGDAPAAVSCPICTAGVGLHALPAPTPASLPNRIAIPSYLAPVHVAGTPGARDLDLASIRGPPAQA